MRSKDTASEHWSHSILNVVASKKVGVITLFSVDDCSQSRVKSFYKKTTIFLR